MLNGFPFILLYVTAAVLTPSPSSGFCDYRPGDHACYSIYDATRRPPLEMIPIHLTNYWPYNPDGSLMAGWGGQCNADCNILANGTRLTPELIDHSAACIRAWTRIVLTVAVTIPGYGEVICNDRFGLEGYAVPFFHPGRGHWVVPVDWLGEAPFYDVVSGWSIRRVPAGPPQKEENQ